MAQHHRYIHLQNDDTLGRSMWQVIQKVKDEFYDCVSIRIQNRLTIRFWHDWWLGKYSLASKYPRLFKISTPQNLSVGELCTGSWRFGFKRQLNPAESIDLLELRYEVREVQLVGEDNDCLEREILLQKRYTRR